ncbi:hypothetical protein [Nocardioides sambongensis]|uniref:hypothetical protein n=1 Tax=Nocardioides sambongensis TaxID=2589074 RepID=UPI00112C41AC|nr:hypothetical protein [Nocardioides sambongensis]
MISTAVRRCATTALSFATLVGVSLLLAGPASADTPMPKPGGWEEKPPVDTVEWLLLFVGIPLLMMLVITALIVGPALARGETLNPAKREPDTQWIGGPRKSAGELAGPDGEGSKAGGAGGSW